jgi:hypothetical protein
MKFTFFRFILLFAVIAFFSSCLNSSDSTTVSSNPSFSSLVFKANDSIPYLSSAKFTLSDYDVLLKDSIIINVDSLPFKTRIDSVYPTFSFKSSAGAKLYFPLIGYKYKKDSAWITGTDTVDFRQPVRVRNFATDGIAHRDYIVKTNVHRVDPEMYVWGKVSDDMSSVNAKYQKAIAIGDNLYYYQNDGSNSYLYTSADGFSWKAQSVTGLPVNTPLNDMIQFNGQIFVSRSGTNLYASSDGLSWGQKTITKSDDFTFQSLLFVLNSQLWAVVLANDNTYHFAISNDGATWNMTKGTIPDNFPVSDFAAVSFSQPTGKAKAVVLSGISANGTPLNNRWSTEDGVYWVDFSVENHTLDTLALGVSVISYDRKLLAFGKRTDNGKTYYKVSKDDGLSWGNGDSVRNVLPEALKATPRSYSSMVVFKPKAYSTSESKTDIQGSNRIFIIGGKSGSTVYSDVWTGKLNRKNFLLQSTSQYYY